MPAAVQGNGLLIHSVAVTTSDSTNLDARHYYFNAVYVGAAGAVVIVKENDDTETFLALTAGVWHNMPPFKRINSTSTTATGIHAGITYSVG